MGEFDSRGKNIIVFSRYAHSGIHARVAELADAPDLGSGGRPWGFKSPLSHQIIRVQIGEPVPLDESEGAERGEWSSE
jgi:hypothetical protein